MALIREQLAGVVPGNQEHPACVSRSGVSPESLSGSYPPGAFPYLSIEPISSRGNLNNTMDDILTKQQAVMAQCYKYNDPCHPCAQCDGTVRYVKTDKCCACDGAKRRRHFERHKTDVMKKQKAHKQKNQAETIEARARSKRKTVARKRYARHYVEQYYQDTKMAGREPNPMAEIVKLANTIKSTDHLCRSQDISAIIVEFEKVMDADAGIPETKEYGLPTRMGCPFCARRQTELYKHFDRRIWFLSHQCKGKNRHEVIANRLKQEYDDRIANGGPEYV